MTVSPDGKALWVLLQSAARQEGGKDATTRRYARLLQYTIKGCKKSKDLDLKKREVKNPQPTYVAEYVVPLPTFTNTAGAVRVAAQSEMHFISPTQFFFLPRDSGAGGGLSSTQSLYRHVDIFDISTATNVKGPDYDAFNASIASTGMPPSQFATWRTANTDDISVGVLKPEIRPATVCPFIDINTNSELAKFGLHNGGAADAGLLNEKWEGIALVPVDGNQDLNPDANNEYFMFVASDNDFITQNGKAPAYISRKETNKSVGFTAFGQVQYQDAAGVNLNNQMLVFKVTLPSGSKPLVG
jgi:hypothetical protein